MLPKFLGKLSKEARERIAKDIMSSKINVIAYVLMRAVEEWKDDTNEGEISVGAFLETYVHNYLSMGESFWRTILHQEANELDISFFRDEYGIECISRMIIK